MATIFLILSFVAVLTLPRACVAMETGSSVDNEVYLHLLRRVENLEKRDQNQQAQIDTLREELITEKQRTAALEGSLTRLQKKLYERENIEAVPIVNESKKPAVAEYGIKQNQPLTSENIRYAKPSGAKTTITRRRADLSAIAFCALLTNHTEIAEANPRIHFDHVVTNIGSAYDPSTGYFSAPLAGVYVLKATIMANQLSYNEVSIVANGVTMTRLFFKFGYFESESATVIVHLDKGYNCFVQKTDANATINGYAYSMFSGFLLYPDVPETIVG